MKFLKHSLKVVHKLDVCEITLFKIYLIVIALLLAIWIPRLMSISVWIYVWLTIIFIIPLMIRLVQQKGNYIAKIFSRKKDLHLLDKRTLGDITLFKLGMLMIGLLIAKLFPLLLTIHIAIYIGIACFGAGYFMAKLFMK